jgi:hypothetical protein
MTAPYAARVAVVAAALAAFAAPLALAADAGAPAPKVLTRADAGGVSKIPPDPPAMRERQQWVFDLRYDRGDLYLVGVHPLDLGAPQETPRVMGRFALELFEGPTLIERVRFDFPFLGASEASRDAGNPISPEARFEPKLTTRIGVVFPATTRGTRMELWDRATGQRWPLPWPIEEGARDAGSG